MRRNLNQIMTKENLEEDHIEEEEIILEKNLIEEEGIIMEKDLIGEEEIIMEKDLIGEEEIILEESQPTKEAVDEITRILLLNLKIRALGTVIENHLLKDSSV